jgi:tripartite-type tricarboxylate transporter receptor subunit TctC
MTNKKSLLAALALGAVCLGISGPGMANDAAASYPDKPVTIIVPFPAGGTSDVMGRLIGDELGKELGQPFIIENKGGAGGVIGSAQAARAKPDGYTLLLSGIGSNAIVHGMTPKPEYDSTRDFIQISQLESGPNVLVVNPQMPAKTLQEFVAYVKKHPGDVTYAVTFGASGHLAMELLRTKAGLNMMGVPYRGGAPGLTAVMAGEVNAMFINQDAALPLVRAGKLRALAVASKERNPLFPDVPTVAESGYPGFEAISWAGLSAPAGTPPEIVHKLETAMRTVFSKPENKERLERTGFVVVASTSQEYSDFVKSEIKKWGDLIKEANIKAK